MVRRGWYLIAMVGLSALLTVQSTATSSASDDVLPWPWGSECPFPWSRIDGDWVVRSERSPERFTFEFTGELQNGGRILAVKRYDAKGILIAIGEGVSSRGERIVRAAMAGMGPEKGNSYWALVRTYKYKSVEKKSCSRTKQVTVITLRSTSSTGEKDVHMILDKEETVRGKRP